MEVGVTVRNMGAQSSVDMLLACVQAAERNGLESVWITDHIAIPPDDAEGSGGRYLDPLITLGFLAGATSRIMLGTGVLILPYRPALPTAKQVATLQELAAGRLLLGVGIGWMDAEFAALGQDRHQRGKDADEILEFLHHCFDNDVAVANGQPFLFRPRPARPPILIGGRAPHALERAARLGDGWLPMGGDPDSLSRHMDEYAALCDAAGRPRGTVTLMTGLPLQDQSRSLEMLVAYREMGIDRLVCALRYETVDEYQVQLDNLSRIL